MTVTRGTKSLQFKKLNTAEIVHPLSAEEKETGRSKLKRGQAESWPAPLSFSPFSRDEALPARGALHLLRVDAADLVRRNQAPALRADCVEGRHHFFEIDFLLLGHAENCRTSAKLAAAALGKKCDSKGDLPAWHIAQSSPYCRVAIKPLVHSLPYFVRDDACSILQTER